MASHDYRKRSLAYHKRLRGKLSVVAKAPLATRDDLSLAYTPGVGAVASYLAEHPAETASYTMRGNTIAVISDGSAVLGLGNIGPEGAYPVMEGKAMILREFAGIDAIPIVLDTQDSREIVRTVQHLAPSFGGINLEDISAPRCFDIEAELRKSLDIPVFHDDQHGTAIIVLAGLINAFKAVRKDIKKGRVVIVGAGAAGIAVTKLLRQYGIRDLILIDSTGTIHKKRAKLNVHKKAIADTTNPRGIQGDVAEALPNADAVIGLCKAGRLTGEDIRLMAERPIVMAMANPVPEIMPDEAKKAGAAVIATGRSDFPNQINNALVFPGVFRGALDNKVTQITDKMKLRAAEALAALVKRPTPEKIIPELFDKRAVKAIAATIRE